jgi:phosphopantothenoylcysteine decarboxylase/phosphopantothenate--cysteine ligase
MLSGDVHPPPQRWQNPSPPADATAPLAGRQILLGVGGGIAAYKAVELLRLIVKAGARARVVMTASASRFVGELTFQTLSGHSVFTELFDLTQESEIGHIQLADRVELCIVAPATANLIARMAAGMADQALTAILLATRAPVLIAPSMNVNMWEHPVTQANLRRLRDVAGCHVIGPGEGFLACRWTGPGRLAEPADILEVAGDLLSQRDLLGRKLVVSAGPTREPLDPARFISNRSSGKMGFALARAARRRGASVVLVAGPVAIEPPLGVTVIAVGTALEMERAVMDAASGADGVIMAAAVADARPAHPAEHKLKKSSGLVAIELAPTGDILAGLGRARGTALRPVLIGFAAETQSVVAYARQKLADKRCDAVVANDVSRRDAGFDSDRNQVTLVTSHGDETWELDSKEAIAHRLLDWLSARLSAMESSGGRS